MIKSDDLPNPIQLNRKSYFRYLCSLQLTMIVNLEFNSSEYLVFIARAYDKHSQSFRL